MGKNVTITINGKQITADSDRTILNIARKTLSTSCDVL